MDATEAERLARLIANRINESAMEIGASYRAPSDVYTNVGVIDDLLPPEALEGLSFPADVDDFIRIDNLAERKHVMPDLSLLADRVRNIVLAFSSAKVAEAISKVTEIEDLSADHELYNGGLTIMRRGDYMNPHLDHTHDQWGTATREVVGLYYLSDIGQEAGGELGLWSPDRLVPPRLIDCRRNRLVLLRISDTAWHSVERLTASAPRVSITTPYYKPAIVKRPIGLTRFRARPEAPIHDVRLELGFAVRTIGSRLGLRRLAPSRHTYKVKT